MLPEQAREELRKAAQTPTDVDPFARKRAIDKAISRLRKAYPEHFKEKNDEDRWSE